MKTDIQFRGNKVVVLHKAEDHEIEYARELLELALKGQLKFAVNRFKPLPKEDYKTNPRSLKWMRNNKHDPWVDKETRKRWKRNYIDLRKSCQLLFREGIISSYHCDESGRLQVQRTDKEEPDKIDVDRVDPIYLRKCQPKSPTERILSRRGRGKTVEVETYKSKKEVLDEIDRLKKELKSLETDEYKNTLAQSERHKHERIDYGVGPARISFKVMGDDYIPYKPFQLYFPYVQNNIKFEGQWSELCDRWRAKDRVHRMLYEAMYKVWDINPDKFIRKDSTSYLTPLPFYMRGV